MATHRIGDRLILHKSGIAVTVKGVISDMEYSVMDDQGNYMLVKRSEIRVPKSDDVHKLIADPEVLKETKNHILGNKKGEAQFYLAFRYSMEGDTDGFITYLVNKSGTTYDIAIQIRNSSENHLDQEFALPAYRYRKLGFIPSALLSLSTSARLSIKQLFTDGSMEEVYKKVSLKSSMMQEAPEKDENLGFKVIRKLIDLKEEQVSDNLKKYADSLQAKEDKKQLKLIDLYNPALRATFQREIDLHLDQLVENPDAYSPGEALEIQLSALRNYLNQAYQVGISSVVVIHGKGKGRLRREIERHCRMDARIEGHRFAYSRGMDSGATEVFFKE